jgi:integrase
MTTSKIQLSVSQRIRKNHSYWLVKYKNGEGKWISKQLSVKLDLKDKVEAEQWFLRNYEKEITDKIAQQGSIMSLVDKWKAYKETKIKDALDSKDQPKQRMQLASKLGHIKNHISKSEIGTIDLSQVKPDMVKKWIDSIQLTPLVVRNIVSTASQIVELAKEEDWINDKLPNVFLHPKVKKYQRDKKAMRRSGKKLVCLTLTEAQQLIDCKKVAINKRLQYLLNLTSGLRIGEILALKWENLTDQVIKVERQLHQESKAGVPIWGNPKSETSNRTIPMHPSAIEALKWWKETEWKAWVGRDPIESDMVFPDKTGKPHRMKPAEELRDDLLLAELPSTRMIDGRKGPNEDGSFNITYHSLRSTWANGCKRAGISEYIRDALLGHSSGRLADGTYEDDELPPDFAVELAKLPIVWRP